ncbi:MAG TPA: hypothetical protein VGO96_04960 [Pyrinomonadaceae bacterium]|jgi:hypothetical protein|nr:hypothetical protein [Pyrinomonadaceae bacterium]
MSWADVAIIVGTLSSAATAVGVGLAWWQLKLTKKQAKTQFEDGLAQQYREIIQQMPVEALLGEMLTKEEYDATLKFFYHYIDLSNEQVFLRQTNKISDETWETWLDGIKDTLSLPAFNEAWKYIKSKATNRFEELRKLEACKFKVDPKDWEEDARSMQLESESPNNQLPS